MTFDPLFEEPSYFKRTSSTPFSPTLLLFHQESSVLHASATRPRREKLHNLQSLQRSQLCRYQGEKNCCVASSLATPSTERRLLLHFTTPLHTLLSPLSLVLGSLTNSCIYKTFKMSGDDEYAFPNGNAGGYVNPKRTRQKKKENKVRLSILFVKCSPCSVGQVMREYRCRCWWRLISHTSCKSTSRSALTHTQVKWTPANDAKLIPFIMEREMASWEWPIIVERFPGKYDQTSNWV